MKIRYLLATLLVTLAPAPTAAAPWDFLPWFGNDGLRDEGTPIDMKIFLRVGDESYEVEDSEDGLSEAEEIFARVFPGEARDGSPRAEASQVHQLLQELLSVDENHAEALRVAGLNRREHFDVNLVLDDHTDPLTPGAVLDVPKHCRFLVFGCKDTYTVKDGDTIESVSEEYGLSEDELRKRNKRNLDIHPHARHEGDFRAVYMGEAGLGKRSDDFDTFMHELGHVGDETSCNAGYGPDGSHRMSEILAPATAFTEGWAQYQAAHLPGRRQRVLADPPGLELETEASDDDGESESRYVTVEASDRTLNDYLGNQARVGSILTAMDQLAPGREAVEAVFLETREDCRSLASVVGAYVQAHPNQADAVREILKEWTDDVGTALDYEQVLAGILPRCLGPKELPRSRDYDPSSERSSGSRASSVRAMGRAIGRALGGRTSRKDRGPVRAESTQGLPASGGSVGGMFGLGDPLPETVDENLPAPGLPPVDEALVLGGCDS
jgi:hypothetical protein